MPWRTDSTFRRQRKSYTVGSKHRPHLSSPSERNTYQRIEAIHPSRSSVRSRESRPSCLVVSASHPPQNGGLFPELGTLIAGTPRSTLLAVAGLIDSGGGPKSGTVVYVCASGLRLSS